MTSRHLSDREYSVLCARGRAYAQSSAPALRAQRCVPLFTPPPPPPPQEEEEEEEEEEEKKKKQIKMRNIDDLRASNATLSRMVGALEQRSQRRAAEAADLRRENEHLQKKVKIFRAEMQRQGGARKNAAAAAVPSR
jgi:hypothetical protein